MAGSAPNMDIVLTKELLDTLNAGSAVVTAVSFSAQDPGPKFTTLFTGDSSKAPPSTGASVPLTVDIPFTSGKIYFVIQSPEHGKVTDLKTIIHSQSDLNWDNSEDNNFRFDSFELTLEGNTFDSGNLTSVNGFGIPMGIDVAYNGGGTSSAGYNVSGKDVFDAIDKMGGGGGVAHYTPSTPGLTGDRMALSPAESVGRPGSPFKASDWHDYLTDLEKKDPATDAPVANSIAVSGFFNGAADSNNVWHNDGFFSYTMEFDAAANHGEGVFWLIPATNSQIKGYIAFAPDELQNSIYETLGSFEIYTSQSDYGVSPYEVYKDGTNINTGENNQWGDLVKNVLVGFVGGYYNVSAKDPHGAEINLNQNWNWDPTYAFGENLASGSKPAYYDPYAAYFSKNTNSYGSGYSDQMMSAYTIGGPLVDLYDTKKISITLYDDDETPSGYVKPEIANYIAPPSSSHAYTVPTSAMTGANISLNFHNGRMVLDETAAEIKISFQTSEKDWATVTLDGDNLWQNWNISVDSKGHYSIASFPGDQPVGSMLINNLPVAAHGGVSWYKIEVSNKDGADSKIFNLYTTTNKDGDFVFSSEASKSPTIAIDGLAQISPPANMTEANTFTIDFMYSTTSTVAPSLLRPVSLEEAQRLGVVIDTPSPVVIGTIPDSSTAAASPMPGSGWFTAFADQNATSDGRIAFGWAGLGNGHPDVSVATNKIDALQVALIKIAGSGLAPIAIVSDLDGQWVSGENQVAHLGSTGKSEHFTITMQQFEAGDKAYTTPVWASSAPLALTVTLADMSLAISSSGQGAQLVENGAEAGGNWIRLQSQELGLSSGTSYIAYAVNDEGQMVSRSGHSAGPGVTLDDATLGYVGTVLSDSGVEMVSAGQSVYLAAGLELRFASVSGSGEINLDPGFTTYAQEDGSVHFSQGETNIAAHIDNTLDSAAAIAGNQRMSNTPWMYLEHGDLIDFQITGSSANTNTLGFVRLDVDPISGEWSVKGVDYGDTDTFRDAVRDSLDTGFLQAHGGRSFSASDTWEVAGENGYYAPVLLTQNGETFVIGDANKGGYEYIRMFGENTFGIEDLAASRGSDFDYNDMVIRFTPADDFLA